MRLNFACLIFVARDDYENILTAKISRFTAHAGIIIIMHMCTTVEACLKDAVLRHGLRIENNRGHLITSPKGHLGC